jgi:hypothetical protein
MMLEPKLLEFIILSILAFIHNKFVAALYLLVYCVHLIRKFRARAAVQGFPGASL